jgi:EAL domain-containing protein (putative c-di-GMP-specific phosphodiesterase class I)
MYVAKDKHLGIAHYRPAYDTYDSSALALVGELRGAIARNELVLHYQPKGDVRAGCVTAVEALVRWNHPTRGLLAPVEFIPLAEDTGLIVPLGQWVLTEACAQGRKWYDASGGTWPQTVTVNLSGRQLVDGVIVDTVRKALEVSGLPARILVLEITETVVLHQLTDVVPHLRALKALGVRIAIDDFGIGAAPFDELRRLPIDALKVDRRFVHAAATSREDEAMVRAIGQLGRGLGLDVVAEGIETARHEAFARSAGCNGLQGYLYSPPVPAVGLARFVTQAAVARIAEH